MGKCCNTGSNILGGGYAAAGADLWPRRVLRTGGGAVLRKFGGLDSRLAAPIGVELGSMAGSSAGSRNDAFPPSSGARNRYVAGRYVARLGQGLGFARFIGASPQIANLTAGDARQLAQRGAAAAEGDRGGFDPLGRRALGDHPRRAGAADRQAGFEVRAAASLHWQSSRSRGGAAKSSGARGVGGTAPLPGVEQAGGATPLRSKPGRGDTPAASARNRAETPTLSGGQHHVN